MLGYQGIENGEEYQERKTDWFIAMRPGKRATLPKTSLRHEVERTKASMRAKVEHAFQSIRQMFGYVKVRYRGLVRIGAGCTCGWVCEPYCGRSRICPQGQCACSPSN